MEKIEMTPIFASFYFEGVERWQLWFDNPNKAAILFAELVVIAVWLVQCRRFVWACAGYLLANAAAFALLHTMSRGGLLACGVGIAFVLRKLRSRKQLALLVVSIVFLFVCAIHLKVHSRCLSGVMEDDASIKNRIMMWSHAPAMFQAAPMGWGLGNSGAIYMKWFQPTDRSERYRTLVNSHLTWLIELGWGVGFIYLFGWFSLFWMAWKVRSMTDRGLSMGIIACLFTGGIFSSVLETIWLWMLPVLTLGLSAVKARWHGVHFVKGFSISVSVALLAMCCFVLLPVSNGSTVRESQNTIRCGKGDPMICLFPDPDVLGGELYMRELRATLKKHSGTVVVISDINDIPRNTDLIVLTGKQCVKMDDVLKSHTDVKLLFISPPFEFCIHLMGKIKEVSCRVRVLVGEFSNAHLQEINDNVVIIVSGANRYIPQWAKFMFD